MTITPTSYFSEPSEQLDPKLFQGRSIQPWVRQGILHLLNDYLGMAYQHPELWSHAWLAGSGVSYQWEASRQPGDLDCLVGIDFVQFRKANPSYAGLSDKDIADDLNDGFRIDLQPQTENWNGYELTFYVNPSATDIRTIKPYAAYDLKYNEWTVHPDKALSPKQNPDWERVATSDLESAHQAITRFNAAMQDVQMSHGEATRRNAEARLSAASQQGNALFDEIHSNRSLAFSPAGEGYGDFHNYRWQAGKRNGTIAMLRQMRDYAQNLSKNTQTNTYGVELPDADTLIRRAALYGRK
jgi:hypothetical protein